MYRLPSAGQSLSALSAHSTRSCSVYSDDTMAGAMEFPRTPELHASDRAVFIIAAHCELDVVEKRL